jgi:ABC-type uncharacterized transport system permease subunit
VGTLLPLEFLPAGARAVAVWTPLPSLSYAPARIAVAVTPNEAFGLIGAQLGWLAAAVILCRLVFAAERSKITIQGG